MRKLAVILLCFFILGSFSTAQDKGNATYYSSKLTGRKTTDGSKYHPDSLTCAHKSYPLGTYLLVRNPQNNQQVVVKVTDRGPFTKKMMIDLSFSAAKSLDIVRQGIANVEVTKLDFLPQGLSILPTPETFLNVDQMVVVKNYLKKVFSDDNNANKKK